MAGGAAKLTPVYLFMIILGRLHRRFTIGKKPESGSVYSCLQKATVLFMHFVVTIRLLSVVYIINFHLLKV